MAASTSAGSAHELPASLRFEGARGLVALTGGGNQPTDGESSLSDLASSLQALKPSRHNAFWQQVSEVTKEHLASGEASLSSDSLDVMHAVAAVLVAFTECGALDAWSGQFLPPAFVECALQCHDLLLSLPNRETQGLIATVLEHICNGDFEAREDFYGGILMFLAGRCLEIGSTAADVERFYKMRALLAELDWEHESIESMKMQLVRCAASPSFARANHGPDMIALFFTLHTSFTGEIHGSVKSQVVSSQQRAMKAYSLAVYKAFRAAEGGIKVQVEHCVQEWATLAIRAERKNAEKARAILEELHRNHHEPSVNKLCCRIYGPLLWRSLKVANFQVRENAARLLQYVFPLLPAELAVAEKEQELAKQLRLLRETLEDPCESVRRVAVGAVCVILKNYWDMIPAADVAELLTMLMNKCARDKNVPLVRAAVCEGFAVVLQNPMSHPSMATAMPQIAELLNDKTPVVRAAFVRLLGVVSNCRGISIASVVKNEDLLVRLTSDHTEVQNERLQKYLQTGKRKISCADDPASPEIVAKQLAQLIAPSLFGLNIVQQVTRCHFMAQHWPLALLALVVHVEDIVPVGDRIKLAAALFRYGVREYSGLGKEQSALIATLFRVVGVLLEGACPAHAKSQKKRSARGGSDIPKRVETFMYDNMLEDEYLPLLEADTEEAERTSGLRESLFYAVSYLDPAKLPRTVNLIREELELRRSGNDDGDSHDHASYQTALLRIASRWNLLNDAFGVWLVRLRGACERLSKRQVVTNETHYVVGMLETVLRDNDMRQALLVSSCSGLSQFVEAFSAAFCKVLTSCMTEHRTSRSSTETPLLGRAASKLWPRLLGLVARLVLHLEHRHAAPPAPEIQAGRATSEDGGSVAVTPDPHGRASKVLLDIGKALTADEVCERLASIEASVASRAACGPSKKPRGRKAGLPSDIHAMIQAHQRILESLSAANVLSELHAAPQRDGSGADDDCASIKSKVEEYLWRWTTLLDSCGSGAHQEDSEEAPSRPARTWLFLARVLQQAHVSDSSVHEFVSMADRLLRRVTGDVPADDNDVKRVLQLLFSRFERDHERELVPLLSAASGLEHDEDKQVPDAHTAMPPRVLDLSKQLAPSFRSAFEKLVRKEETSVYAQNGEQRDHSSPDAGQQRKTGERCRSSSSPTPQKNARPASTVRPVGIDGVDLEEMSTEEPNKGNIIPKQPKRRKTEQEPLTDADSVLFQTCFPETQSPSRVGLQAEGQPAHGDLGNID